MVYWGLYRDNGKEHGNYYIVYWGNGKEHGNSYMVYWGYIGIMEKKMETAM